VTLAAAQAAFRQSPNQSTALAYMDAAIERWERSWIVYFDNGKPFDATVMPVDEQDMHAVCKEIRNWLAIPITDFSLRLRDVEDTTVRAAVAKLEDPDATR
jgi:hypothetical protein